MAEGARPLSWHPRFAIDPQPFARGGSVAICAVSVMHIIQAWLLWCSSATANATPMAALIFAFNLAGQGSSSVMRALPPVLIATAALSLWGALFRLGWIRLALFVPQHVMLGIMVTGGIFAVIHGVYLDGTVKPWEHIAADQIGLLALFLVHTSAILRRCADPNG